MRDNMKLYLNHKGVTLIEILASITILFLVLLYFLSFFGQATLLSTKTEDRLTAINIAEKVLNEVSDDSAVYTGNNQLIDGTLYQQMEIIQLNGKQYFPYVSLTPETPESLHLKVVHVQIYAQEDYSPGATPASEIYGYKKEESP